MAYEVPGFSYTLVAAVDLDGSLFRGVDVNNAGKAVLPAAAGRIVGFINNKAKTGEAVTVIKSGIVQAEASAAIAAGDDVMVDNTGRVATLAGAGAVKVGVALEPASAAGIIIAVLLDD